MRLCKHFGSCGGCAFQDVPYGEQLRRKEEGIGGLLSYYNMELEPRPINAGGEWFYRNKMEFTFAEGANGRVLLGLHGKENKREVLDIEECLISFQDAGEILKAVKEFAARNGYSVYGKRARHGFLRNLIVREAKSAKGLLVAIVTTSASELDTEGFIARLTSLELRSKIKSIYWIVNDSRLNAVVFEEKRRLYGLPGLEEEIGGLKFLIGVDTFFQVNPAVAGTLYGKIRDYAALSGSEKVLDLFCGAGCIGIFLSGGAASVLGVEVREEIIEMARENSRLNGARNISFFASDARRFLSFHGAEHRDTDTLVINPPRSGLSQKIIRGVLRLGARQILYSSCNPKTLFADLKGLTPAYETRVIEPFDLFPHTPHVECLAVLRKKTASS